MGKFPHTTWLGVLRDAVHAWRRREHWSVETVADELVQAYFKGGFESVQPVDFHRPGHGRDVMLCMKANCERISRWLDDQSKDKNLLNPNLMPWVLAALPLDLRLAAAGEMLARCGLSVGVLQHKEVDASHAALLTCLIRESGEGMVAFSQLDEQADLARLKRTEVELEESLAEQQRALDFVRNRLAAGG